MKINTNKNTRKNSSTIAVVVALALILSLTAGSFVYVYAFNGNLFGWQKPNNSPENTQNTINYEAPTDEQVDTGTSIKEDSLTDKTDNSTTEINISITAANQNADTLQVRALIPSVTSLGTCTLSLTMGTQVVTKTSQVQAQSNASTCKGFDVPVTELAKGTWNIEVAYKNGDQTGSALGKVEIK